jgi:hypothetical protein
LVGAQRGNFARVRETSTRGERFRVIDRGQTLPPGRRQTCSPGPGQWPCNFPR